MSKNISENDLISSQEHDEHVNSLKLLLATLQSNESAMEVRRSQLRWDNAARDREINDCHWWRAFGWWEHVTQ